MYWQSQILSVNLSVQFTNVDISVTPITLSCDVQHPVRTPSTGAAGARSNIDTSIYVSCFHRHVMDVVEAIMSYTHQTRAIYTRISPRTAVLQERIL